VTPAAQVPVGVDRLDLQGVDPPPFAVAPGVEVVELELQPLVDRRADEGGVRLSCDSAPPTLTGATAPEVPRESFAIRLAIEARSAYSGSADRYCRPMISADASRAEKRGESSIATRLVMTISSSFSKASQSMSNRSSCW
jgi:hypothetical protein